MLSARTQHLLRLASIPSVTFAALVFACGWLDVSPFAAWPLGLVILLCAPSVVPFVLLLFSIEKTTGRRVLRRPTALKPPPPGFLVQKKFRWRSVLTRRRAIVLAVLAGLVSVSFVRGIVDHRGTPERVDGELVFTDHGKAVGPATQRDADEASTRDSRMFSGHLMLFGMAGLLAQIPPLTGAALETRPGPTGRRTRNRPGGPRRQPADDEPDPPSEA